MPTNLPPNSANGRTPPPGMGIDDILFTLFRHKELILGCFLLGLCGAALVRALFAPVYLSETKLNVPYISEHIPMSPVSPGETLKFTDPNGLGTMGTELDILQSFDVYSNVVSVVTPERILGKKEEAANLLGAVGRVSAGLEVTPSHASTLTLLFRHHDPSVPQAVLSALVSAYKIKSLKVHVRELDDEFYEQRVKAHKARLDKVEEEERALKRKADVLSVDDTMKAYQEHLLKTMDRLADAQRELAEARSVMADAPQLPGAPAPTNSATSIPADRIEAYNKILSDLNVYKLREREYKLKDYTDIHPLMLVVRGELEKLSKQKTDMIAQFPALASLTISPGATNASGGSGLNADLAEIRRLTTRVAVLADEYTNLQASARNLVDIAPLINSLDRQRVLEETNYQTLVRALDAARISSSLDAGKQGSITVVEPPTPPSKDVKKLKKLLGAVLGGCMGLGLGLAFLIDFVLDRSIKRTVDIERYLDLPVLQSIPDTSWTNQLRLPWSNGGSERKKPEPGHAEANGNGNGNGNGHDCTSIARWDPTDHLHPYAEGLRERLLTFFEVNNLDLKKPKLVGLTACARGCGVSTLANGLAASLSKTGNGSVLFVDMNTEEGARRSFYQGKAGCEQLEVLARRGHHETEVEEKLAVASVGANTSNKLVKAGSGGIVNLLPELKASEYDYIVFDLPPVAQTNSSARLAGYMDITLLVIESEKTGQQIAMKVHGLMREAHARVATVLNKCHKHIPERLSQDL